MSYLSISTWSLHRLLGPLRQITWDKEQQKHAEKTIPQPELTPLLEVPSILASKGFKGIEICYFNFPSVDSDYLQKLKTACKEANITLQALLIDYGDISSANEIRRKADIKFIKKWIDVASEVGAERVRIIAGDSDPNNQEALACCSKYMNELVAYARERGVHVITENYLSLTSTAANCIEIIKNTNEQIGIIADFGNFTGPTKYDEIAKILPYSESIHAKADYDENGLPDEEEFRKCLNLLAPANYDGPISLIYDGPGDMWQGIDRIKRIVESYL